MSAAALSGVAAALLALAVALAAPLGRPAYSHVSQYISELGETGAPNAVWVRIGFALIGLCALTFVASARRILPASRRTTAGLLCLAAVGAAYLVSALAPCDAGCPAVGSVAQSVHNLFGMLEYVGGVAGLLLLSAAVDRRLAMLCRVAALLVAIGFAGMLLPSLATVRGVAQRVAEVALFGCFAAIGVGGARSAAARQMP